MKIACGRLRNAMTDLLVLCLFLLFPAALPVRPQQEPPSAATPGFINAVAFSPDGKLVAIALQRTLRLMKVGSWELRWQMTMPEGAILAVAFSQDGSRLASCLTSFRSRSPIGEPMDYYAKMRTIDVESGSVISEANGAGATGVRGLGFAADGSVFAVVVRYDAEVILWNASTGRLTPVLSNQRFRICSAAFSPAGDRVAIAITTAKGLNEFDIQLYDLDTGSLDGSVAKGSSLATLHPLAFSPDSKLLAFGSEDWQAENLLRTEICLVDPESRKVVRRIKRIDFPLSSLTFSPDSRTVVATGIDQFWKDVRPAVHASRLCAWDAATGRLLKEVSKAAQPNQPLSRIMQALPIPKQGLLFLVHSSGIISLLDPRTAETRESFSNAALTGAATASLGTRAGRGGTRGRPGPVVSAFRVLALSFPAVDRVIAGSDDGRLYALDLKLAGVRARTYLAPSVSSMAIAPDAKIVACADGQGGGVEIHDTISGEILRTLSPAAGPVVSLAFSPNGEYLAGGCANGMVTIWNTSEWKALSPLTGHRGVVRTLSFSADSATLATGSDDLTIGLWTIQTLQAIQPPIAYRQKINALAFSPNGSTLAGGFDDAAVILWNVRDPKVNRKLDGFLGRVNGVSLSPDGSLLASGGDTMVRVWDALSGRSIRILTENLSVMYRMNNRREAVMIYNDSVKVVAFSPDGKVLLCGGGNNTVLAWDTASWKYRVYRLGD